MKTVQKGEDVRRVANDKAEEMVGDGWKYVPKGVFKNKNNPKPVEAKEVKSEKKAKKSKKE